MFSTTELNGMRETQNAHMMDVCVIYAVIKREKNSRGELVKTFDEGRKSVCGLQMDPAALAYASGYAEADIDAVLRLPHGTEVTVGDEIEITQRFGETVGNRRYEVERFLNTGPSGVRAYLKSRSIA